MRLVLEEVYKLSEKSNMRNMYRERPKNSIEGDDGWNKGVRTEGSTERDGSREKAVRNYEEGARADELMGWWGFERVSKRVGI